MTIRLAIFAGLTSRLFSVGSHLATFVHCRALVRALLVTLAVVGWHGRLHAFPPFGASAGAGPSTTNSYNLAGTGWVVDDGSFPAAFGFQEIAHDPASGPWHKRLLGVDGGEFAASDTGVGALMVFGITELITIGGTTPWTDWHEQILQPGWRWLDDRSGSGEPNVHFASGVPVPGHAVSFTDPTPSEGGKIDFTFPPLAPGTSIRINKRLIYEGLDPLLPGDAFFGTLDIYQYPTVPEPATGWLVGTLLLAAKIRIRSRD